MPDFKQQTDVLAAMSYWDIAVFVFILTLTVASVIYGQAIRKRGRNKMRDYMVMGRRLSLPLFVATLVASWYGGIFGVNEITFNYGVYNFVTQGMFWYAAYIIFALFLVEKIKRYKSITMPQLAENMFGKYAKRTTAVFTFFNVLPVSYALSLGIFLKLIFGWNLIPAMCAGAFFVCLYASYGGLRAVVFSDIIQFAVMCLSVLIVLIYSLSVLGGPSFLTARLPASHFTLTGGQGLFNTFAWGAIALSTLVDPVFYQRCFAAKDTRTAKAGILISTLIWFCFDICTTAGALYARAVMPDAEPSHAYFLYALQLLPDGLRGFFVAGILATILSTLDSFLFVASNTLGFDLLKNKFKNALLANQIMFFVVAAFAIIMAMLLDGNFKKIWFAFGSYMSACILIPMMLGHILPKKISDAAFAVSAISAAGAITLWDFVLKNIWNLQIDGFYIGVLISGAILSFNIIKKRYESKQTSDFG
jgi:SSS family solute:Na+ symporter